MVSGPSEGRMPGTFLHTTPQWPEDRQSKITSFIVGGIIEVKVAYRSGMNVLALRRMSSEWQLLAPLNCPAMQAKHTDSIWYYE